MDRLYLLMYLFWVTGALINVIRPCFFNAALTGNVETLLHIIATGVNGLLVVVCCYFSREIVKGSLPWE